MIPASSGLHGFITVTTAMSPGSGASRSPASVSGRLRAGKCAAPVEATPLSRWGTARAAERPAAGPSGRDDSRLQLGEAAQRLGAFLPAVPGPLEPAERQFYPAGRAVAVHEDLPEHH